MRKDCMGVQENCELLTIRGRLCVCLTFRLAHKVSDTLQLIVKTKRINTFNTLAGRFCL